MSDPTRVFISYSHENEANRQHVLDVSNRLRAEGVDAWIDRYEVFPSEGWARWIQRQIDQADFILVVCTRIYKNRFEGVSPDDEGRDNNLAGFYLQQKILRNGMENPSVIPVWFRDEDRDHVPGILEPFSRFRLPDDYDGLYRLLTEQPGVAAPALGPLTLCQTHSDGAELDDWLPADTDPTLVDYLSLMCNLWFLLKLKAFGGEGSEQDMKLDQVFIELNTQTPVEIETKGEETRRLTALEAAARDDRILLLGDPGSGKSSFVNMLLGRIARARLREADPLPGFHRDLLPVRLIFRHWVAALQAIPSGVPAEKRQALIVDSALTYLLECCPADHHNAWKPCLAKRLLRDELVVVLDGLDEVAPALRGLAAEALAAIRTFWNPVRMIVTCRIRSHDETLLPGYAVHTLAPFDKDQVSTFIDGWYQTQFRNGLILREQDAVEKAKSLSGAVTGEDLESMARNPMLLTTMAIVHYKEGELPEERVKLYHIAVDVLVNQWKEGKDRADCSPELRLFLSRNNEVLSMLQDIGHHLHESGSQQGDQPLVEATQDELVCLLKESMGSFDLAAEFLDYIDRRAGILQGVGGSGKLTYSFPHRTFQEYLAGCYLVRDKRRAHKILLEKAAVGDYWMLAGQLGLENILYNTGTGGEIDALDLADKLCPRRAPDTEAGWRGLLWSGQLAERIGKKKILEDEVLGAAAYWEDIRDYLVSLIREERLPVQERVQAGRLLGALEDPRFECDDLCLPVHDGCGFERILESGQPPVTFIMGDNESEWDDEKPEHEVTLTAPFALAIYPVTQAQFGAFVNDPAYGDDRFWPDETDGAARALQHCGQQFECANHPVVGVSWFAAMAYCAWLTERLKKKGFRDELFAGPWNVTLPTEAQWEFAVRKNQPRPYPFEGEPAPDKLNAVESEISGTSAVGCFPGGVTATGLYDMAGNVWEWCLDGQRSYDGQPARDPHAEGPHRAFRGGSWDNSARYCRSSYRNAYVPEGRDSYLGFRLALSPVQPAG